MKTKYLTTVLLLFITSTIQAQIPLPQTNPVNYHKLGTYRNLNVGDPVPDFKIPKIIHSPQRSAKISDFKNELLIADFWSINCPGCVAELPKMYALQKMFGNKIKILPVTFEEEPTVLAFWKTNKYTKALNQLPSVVEDKNFSSHFQHLALPHEVWIYKGKVIGITAPDYVDAYNIRLVLSGKTPNWPVKDDFYTFDGSKEFLFKPDPDQIDVNNTPLKYAAISDYKEHNGADASGLFGSMGTVRDTVKKTVRTYFINEPIYTAYFLYWSKLIKPGTLVKPASFGIGPNEVLWEVDDKSKYIFSNSGGYRGDWMRDHAICFESLNPDSGKNDQEIAKSVITDLNRLLGLDVRWGKHKEKVLVLVKENTNGLKKSKPVDFSLANLAYGMNQKPENPYVFNETNEDGVANHNLDITSWTDIAAIRRALQPYGISLKEEERLVDKFIFSEINGGLLVDAKMQAAEKARRAAQVNLKDPTPDENNSFLEVNKKKPGVIVLPSGLQYKIIKQGDGPVPNEKNTVKINYTGMLVNGKIFDSSLETGRSAEFPVNEVIKGWTEALKMMPEGSKWILYIPAALAYAEHTGHGKFPPNSNLIFEIELLKITK